MTMRFVEHIIAFLAAAVEFGVRVERIEEAVCGAREFGFDFAEQRHGINGGIEI